MASKSHKSNLVAKARKFQQQQGEIDRRLLIVTNSETSDVAVRKFSESMERLGRLDVAKGYVELLKTVERLGLVSCVLRMLQADRGLYTARKPARTSKYLLKAL